MKVHKLTIMVIDFDGLGAEGVRDEIVRVRYPNDCLSPTVLSVETWDVGEWDDDHPLNSIAVGDMAAAELFKTKPESTIRSDDQ